MNVQEYKQEYNDDGKSIHCDVCGGDYREGQFPFCKGVAANHGTMYGFDDAFEPYVDTQLLDRKDPRCDSVDQRGVRGVFIDSRSKRREIMKEQGLQYGSQKFDTRGKLYFHK
jgi:hypothetical protein